ncbi:glycosyl transferase [Nocardioides marinquilinus]|uniref:Glycosyl transferase n=1 Tax=Nocardioides marinquilinus TaxID=1210400 RepID=A0ABP9P7C2_9ACTN
MDRLPLGRLRRVVRPHHEGEPDVAPDASPGRHAASSGSETLAPGSRAAAGRPGRIELADLLICGGFLLATIWLYHGLWGDLSRGYLINGGHDQNQWEWYSTVVADNVRHLRNPFETDLQNYPYGVNLAANAAMPGLNIPLAPLTWVFGATLTWAIVLTAGLAGTASGWYWVFSRHLVPNRTAAAIGGGFAAFAPAMISHANAHPNFVVLFVLPFIALKTIQVARGARPVRDGVVLGLLVAWQITLGEEALAIFAMTFVLFAAVWLVAHRHEARAMVRPAATGLGVGAAVCLVIVGFMLYWQFFGPQSFHSLLHGPSGNDVWALTRFATQSVAGAPEAAAAVSLNRTEENAFFGWPLIALVVMLTVWLWRDVTARALAVAAIVMSVLSLGSVITKDRLPTDWPSPWALFDTLPLLDSILESRLAMGAVPLVGGLLAIATHRVWVASSGWGLAPAAADDAADADADPRALPVRLLWAGALAAVLLPIAPKPLLTVERPPVPEFFAGDQWREYVDPGGVVVTAPLPSTGETEPLRWQVATDLQFLLPEGYFVGPTSPEVKDGRYGAVPRPTSTLFSTVDSTGTAAAVTEEDRRLAREDLDFWDAEVVVVGPRANQQALVTTIDALLNRRGVAIGGVVVWDVRDLTD